MSASWTEAKPHPARWLLIAALPLLLWLLLRPSGIAVEVKDKSWQRQIEVERQVMELHSDWCSEMPADAELIARQPRGDALHCRYRAPVWRMRRVAHAEGTGASEPSWPDPALKGAGTPDAERSGRRHAWQSLRLEDSQGRHWTCQLPLPAWRGWRVGERTRLAVHRFSGVADCASLPAAPR
jgi:hypothetical protein